MDRSFHMLNRSQMVDKLPDGSLALMFAGEAPRQSADQFYSYYANRSFVYMTGLEKASAGFVLAIEKQNGQAKETLFLLPPDAHAERWNGRRVKPDEAKAISGIENIAYLEALPAFMHAALSSGRISEVWIDLYRLNANEPDGPAHIEAARIAKTYPNLVIKDLCPVIRKIRTIKKPCEIEAMRKAAEITGAGIAAMMKASKPGMYEYEYKAEFDRELTRRGVIEPGFPSIIAAGENNFCIHYYDYSGQAKDGDMVLNDVGARWDGVMNDVSRGWPCNGVFTEKQRILYECAYKTSEYMFSIIKPGMPMADVDKTIHAYCAQLLVEAGVLDKVENERKYMWHGGAHHVGWDVHDIVDATGLIEAGMVFCVDVGIYVEEWGIGFRLEDNCYVTEDGCECLTRNIPRSIEEIEAAMRG